ncbi:MAG TPA: protein kinase [Polyangiaceae bacterium]|nr:protein kinase [Polyangiaceae bacterium]
MDASPPLTGALLAGAYRVGRLLGEGAAGAVYEGTQEVLGRPVAIKVLKTRVGHDELTAGQLERFGREARAAAALGHPNIVQVTDFHAASSPPFLVMERLAGESLRAAIAREGRLPAGRVALIGTQLLDALGAAHAAGIVHRDVKPDNVFLARMAGVSDLVKVLDFGIAKLESERPLTAHGARMGSPAYMSPEQAAGRAADHRTDLYCAGATLYHALAGRLPFDTQSLGELLAWIAERPPTPLALAAPGLDPRMIAVVERAMAKDPAQRFQSAAEMQQALAPLLHGAPRPRTELYAPLPDPRASLAPGPPAALVTAPAFTGTLAHAGPPAPARRSARGPWLFVLLGGVMALAVVAIAASLYLGPLRGLGARGAPEEDGEGPLGYEPPAPPPPAPKPPADEGPIAPEWAIQVPTMVPCTANRYRPFGDGGGPWRVFPPATQTGLGSQLALTLLMCPQRCPRVSDAAVYFVRVYSDGAVTEAKIAPGTPTCPARDNCVDQAMRLASIEAPPNEQELELEVACTFGAYDAGAFAPPGH